MYYKLYKETNFIATAINYNNCQLIPTPKCNSNKNVNLNILLL